MAAWTFISNVVFILLFVHVRCEEEQEANTSDNGTNANVIQFHYDKNSSQTFAITTFASKDSTLRSFTVCLSLIVDAVEDGSLDNAWVFQAFDKNEKHVTGVGCEGHGDFFQVFFCSVLIQNQTSTTKTCFAHSLCFILCICRN